LYTDPVTGISVTYVMVIAMAISATTSGGLSIVSPAAPHPTEIPAIHSMTSNSDRTPRRENWGFGAGICDSSTTSDCSGPHSVSWGSQNGMMENVTVPSFTDSGGSTSIQLNGAPNSTDLIQITLTAPSSGSTWNEGFQFLYPKLPHGGDCTTTTGTVSAGTYMSLQILYTTGGNKWVGVINGNYIAIETSYCSGDGPNPQTTTFDAENQEPFAVESTDTTASHFNSLLVITDYVYKYSSNVNCGSNCVVWNTNTAYVVTTTAAWGPFVIGGSAPPTGVVEAGIVQCSTIAAHWVYLGSNTQSPLSSTCGTATEGTRMT
jgi:hypothetical protein